MTSSFPLFPAFPPRVINGALRIGVLNLMPDKQATEERFRNLLPDTTLHFIRTESYQSRHTDPDYLAKAYQIWREVAPNLHGLIITGAPLGQADYADVAYWTELHDIVSEAVARRIPVLALCWGALAVAKIVYGIDKVLLPEKAFGNYPIRLNVHASAPRLGKGTIHLPVSRYAAFDEAAVATNKNLHVLGQTDGLGSQILWDAKRQILLCAAHPEYAPDRLQFEYDRDIAKGLPTKPPLNGHFADNFIGWHGAHFFAAWRAFVAGEPDAVIVPQAAARAENTYGITDYSDRSNCR